MRSTLKYSSSLATLPSMNATVGILDANLSRQFPSSALPGSINGGYSGTPRSVGSTGLLLTEEELTDLLKWVDSIPLSRPKRNFTRDFSDACLVAEIVHRLCPRLVELHNYPPANSMSQKIYNWNTLSSKVLRKLGCSITDETMHQIVKCKPGIVETVLFDIRQKLLFHSLSHNNYTLPQIHHTGTATYENMIQSTRVGAAGGMTGQPLPPNTFWRERNSMSRASMSGMLMKDSVPPSVSNVQSMENGVGMPELDKESLIITLRDTVGILQEKIHKLELLLALKDRKIQELLKQ